MSIASVTMIRYGKAKRWIWQLRWWRRVQWMWLCAYLSLWWWWWWVQWMRLPSAYLSGMFPFGSALSRNSALYPLNLVIVIIGMMTIIMTVTSSSSVPYNRYAGDHHCGETWAYRAWSEVTPFESPSQGKNQLPSALSIISAISSISLYYRYNHIFKAFLKLAHWVFQSSGWAASWFSCTWQRCRLPSSPATPPLHQAMALTQASLMFNMILMRVEQSWPRWNGERENVDIFLFQRLVDL